LLRGLAAGESITLQARCHRPRWYLAVRHGQRR
jgi:hypothetical protein